MHKPWTNRVSDWLEVVHTLPVNDLAPHDESPGCRCRPALIRHRCGVQVVHNSWDGREILERAVLAAFRRAGRN